MPWFSFKLFLNRIHIFIKKDSIVEKKSLWLVLPYIGTISLGLNCKSPSKWYLSVVNYRLFSKVACSRNLYMFQHGLCNEPYYGECIRHPALRSNENIGISPLTKEGYNHLSELKESLLIMRDRPSIETFVPSLFLSLPLSHYIWMNRCCTLETFAISLLVILRKVLDLNFNYQYIPSKHSSWWRRLEDVLRLHLQKTSSRRLGQDKYICLTHTSSGRLEDVLMKTNIFVLVIRL